MAKTEHMAGGGTQVSASREERRPKRKKLHRVSIERAKNGGHTVEHSYRHGSALGDYEGPVTHVFSKKDGSELIQHLKRHLGIMDGQHGAAGVVNEADED